MAYVHHCELCDREFESSHRRSRFCSTRCRQTTTSSPIYVRECATCSKPTTFQRPLGKYCSNACKQIPKLRTRGVQPFVPAAPRSRLNWQTCAWCSRWYVKRGHARTCPSPQCADAYDAAQREAALENGRRYYRQTYISVAETNPTVEHTCPECGSAFSTNRYSAVRVYCSPACTARAAHRSRRHRERQAQRQGERFTLREIAERDGWRCHLCDKRVPDRPSTFLPDDPTLDHLIPLSQDGQHTRANVALAHWSCNVARGTAGVAQLRLVG